MGRAPCCDKANVKKGPWSPEEDAKLKDYIDKHGTGGNWIALPQKAGLRRCGKSCRLRWLNYLRPNIKHGEFSDDEDRIICNLFATIGSRWSIIAAQLPGRTDNDIKNYWNTKLKKKLMGMVPSSLMKRPNHQATIYPSVLSFLQTTPPSSFSYTPSSSSSPPPPPPYDHSTNNTYYTNTPTATSLLTSCDIQQPISIPSCFLNTSTTINLQTQEGYVGPLHSFQADRESSTTLMFGGDQASCSSSDGKDAEYGHVTNGDDHQQMGLQGYHHYMTAGVVDDGLYGETAPLDYGLEEIKQLIITNVCNNFNPFVDENKREEKVLYY